MAKEKLIGFISPRKYLLGIVKELTKNDKITHVILELNNVKDFESFAEIFKKEIKQLVDSINKRPELVMRLSKLVPLVKFDWSYIEAIICGLKSELLMDKAILVIVDAWERYTQKKDDICYKTIEHFRDYAYDQNGMYEVNRPIRMLKYIDIKKDLEGIKDSELKRRRIDARFKKMILPAAKQEPTEKHGEKPEFNYTEETFKKSAVITDTQLDLVLAELIVMGWMPTTSSQASSCASRRRSGQPTSPPWGAYPSST